MNALTVGEPHMTDGEVLRYVRESMPLHIGVVSHPDTKSEKTGGALLTLMVFRTRAGKVLDQSVMYVARKDPQTRSTWSTLVERYLDMHSR